MNELFLDAKTSVAILERVGLMERGDRASPRHGLREGCHRSSRMRLMEEIHKRARRDRSLVMSNIGIIYYNGSIV